MDKRRALAFIPARGNSKRLPRKNILDLGGKPLLAHTIEAALESGCFADIVVSSEDEEILQVASGYKVQTVKREARLTQDHVKALDLILEMMSDDEVRSRYDVVALLLPTVPFRQAVHLQAGMALLQPDVDAVISVTKYDTPPQFAITLEVDSGIMKPFVEPSPLLSGATQTQEQAATYHPNGGFYMAWLKPLLEHRSFFRGNTVGYPMPRLDSVDIDEEMDLLFARFLWSLRG